VSVRFSIGWCENGGALVPNIRETAMSFGAAMEGVCVYALSDTTTPPIALEHFATSDGSAQQADIAYLVGHGNGAGTGFLLPNGNAIRHDSVKFGGELKWVVLDCCAAFVREPMYHDPSYWRKVFNGLHQLLGHEHSVKANPKRAERFARYLRDGLTIQEAWRRAVEDSDYTANWAIMHIDDPAVVAEGLHSPEPPQSAGQGIVLLLKNVAVDPPGEWYW
jgi:Family of unknown function (DUF6345)